jgi:hypothetical protein
VWWGWWGGGAAGSGGRVSEVAKGPAERPHTLVFIFLTVSPRAACEDEAHPLHPVRGHPGGCVHRGQGPQSPRQGPARCVLLVGGAAAFFLALRSEEPAAAGPHPPVPALPGTHAPHLRPQSRAVPWRAIHAGGRAAWRGGGVGVWRPAWPRRRRPAHDSVGARACGTKSRRPPMTALDARSLSAPYAALTVWLAFERGGRCVRRPASPARRRGPARAAAGGRRRSCCRPSQARADGLAPRFTRP